MPIAFTAREQQVASPSFLQVARDPDLCLEAAHVRRSSDAPTRDTLPIPTVRISVGELAVADLEQDSWSWLTLLWLLVLNYALLGLFFGWAAITGYSHSELFDIACAISPALVGMTFVAIVGWRWTLGPHDRTR